MNKGLPKEQIHWGSGYTATFAPSFKDEQVAYRSTIRFTTRQSKKIEPRFKKLYENIPAESQQLMQALMPNEKPEIRAPCSSIIKNLDIALGFLLPSLGLEPSAAQLAQDKTLLSIKIGHKPMYEQPPYREQASKELVAPEHKTDAMTYEGD